MEQCNCTGPVEGSRLCLCELKLREVANIASNKLELANQLKLANQLEQAKQEVLKYKQLLDTPELHDFSSGVVKEALHQRERWGSEHDSGKTAADWFWLIGYLAQKVLYAVLAKDRDKALHHCISTAAALANWHEAIAGRSNSMRPGIEDPS